MKIVQWFLYGIAVIFLLHCVGGLIADYDKFTYGGGIGGLIFLFLAFVIEPKPEAGSQTPAK
jgi:hypothetical protein